LTDVSEAVEYADASSPTDDNDELELELDDEPSSAEPADDSSNKGPNGAMNLHFNALKSPLTQYGTLMYSAAQSLTK